MNSFSRPHPAAVPARPKVVIAGGGFAGLAAARSLRHAPVEVNTARPRNQQRPPAAAVPMRNRAAPRRADNPATSQTPPPYGPRREVPGGC
jgi:threonine dehydrogenase-like Zn-dependent dehydrogenase